MRFAFVTPSFRNDLDRCRLLCRTIDTYVAGDYMHYVIVDRRDMAMFESLAGPKRRVLSVESVLPPWIVRLPIARRWWLSLRTLPIRNWILQQIVKLSMGHVASEDVLLFVDSDVAFIRPFDPKTLVRDGKVRIYDEPGKGDYGEHLGYNRAAGRLLGLPKQDYYGSKYIGNIITWRRDNLLKL